MASQRRTLTEAEVELMAPAPIAFQPWLRPINEYSGSGVTEMTNGCTAKSRKVRMRACLPPRIDAKLHSGRLLPGPPRSSLFGFDGSCRAAA